MITLRPVTAILLFLGLAAVPGACGGDKDKDKGTKVTTETTAGGEKNDGTAVSLKALLSPAEEVPGPGVKDGVGAALIDIAGPKVCSDLKATMGEKPLKAHIHQGAKGASGPVVVDLMPAFNPGESAYTSRTCVETTADTASQLIADPAGYYVNIHSDGHPDGAMRGQLAKF
ncbi:MAG TPA: CHRD domain-containing protein [Acidimicrobiia bacterium]|nr:CHRD domain-containing protein [Acidimicrobiia bacterium]